MRRFVTHVLRVQPESISVAADGTAKVRVVGGAYGLICCDGQRRWVWGRFDEVFGIPAERNKVSVWAIGLGGVVRRTVDCWLRFDVRAAKVRLGRLCRVSPKLALPSRPPRVGTLPLCAPVIHRGVVRGLLERVHRSESQTR